MKVAKWGNSLAIRVPADVARHFGLKEGDAVELSSTGPGKLSLALDERRARALEAIRSIRGALPADYRFDREEANAR